MRRIIKLAALALWVGGSGGLLAAPAPDASFSRAGGGAPGLEMAQDNDPDSDLRFAPGDRGSDDRADGARGQDSDRREWRQDNQGPDHDGDDFYDDGEFGRQDHRHPGANLDGYGPDGYGPNGYGSDGSFGGGGGWGGAPYYGSRDYGSRDGADWRGDGWDGRDRGQASGDRRDGRNGGRGAERRGAAHSGPGGSARNGDDQGGWQTWTGQGGNGQGNAVAGHNGR